MSRAEAQLQELEKQVEAIDSNLLLLEEAIEEAEIEEAAESLEHLRTCAASLSQALESGSLRALPILDLSELQKLTTSAANVLPPMSRDPAGQQAPFTNQVDALHRKLWASRLIAPEAGVAAYMRAAGNLSEAMETGREQLEELRDGLAFREQIEKHAASAAEILSEAESNAAALRTVLENAQTTEEGIQSAREQADDLQAVIEKHAASARDADERIGAIEDALTEWHQEVDSRRTALETLRDSTGACLKEYDADIKRRQADLEEISKRIDEQFRLASSGALAKSFGERGNALVAAKRLWGALATGSYVFAICFALWLASSSIPEPVKEGAAQPTIDWQYFLVRLAVGIPIAFLAWFATTQFSKARRVQESYAFKGAVASSFDAYRELVIEITKDPELRDRPEFAQFITRTISDLYTKPQLDIPDEDSPPHTKTLKEASALIRELGGLAGKLR